MRHPQTLTLSLAANNVQFVLEPSSDKSTASIQFQDTDEITLRLDTFTGVLRVQLRPPAVAAAQEDTHATWPLDTDDPVPNEPSPKKIKTSPSKVEQLVRCGQATASNSSAQSSPHSHDDATPTPPARVSIAPSPATPALTATTPSPRWGHTLTALGDDHRLILYGGQTIEDQRPQTLDDLYIYDARTQQWCQPVNCHGRPRQWHTATYIPSKQLLLSFGGEETGRKRNNNKDTLMVLDTEIMLWYPPSVSGDGTSRRLVGIIHRTIYYTTFDTHHHAYSLTFGFILLVTVPAGRSGHTATLLNDTNLIVFGGVTNGAKWLNSVSLLDTTRWTWRTLAVQGSAPPPRSYHSATALQQRKLIVFGGNGPTQSYNTLHVLEALDDGTWRWTHPTARGETPKPRTGHSAILLQDGKTVAVYGGWDPNEEDDDQNVMFDDCFLLDTERYVWTKVELPERLKKVGHAAVHGKNNEMLVFGGRVPGDQFSGNLDRVQLPLIK